MVLTYSSSFPQNSNFNICLSDCIRTMYICAYETYVFLLFFCVFNHQAEIAQKPFCCKSINFRHYSFSLEKSMSRTDNITMTKHVFITSNKQNISYGMDILINDIKLTEIIFTQKKIIAGGF